MRFRIVRFGLVAAVTLVCGAQTIQTGSSTAAAALSTLPAPTAALPNRIEVGGGFGGGVFARNLVTGEPYSAEQETQTVQTLADGTRITNGVQKVTFYRDSQGRTRAERTAPQPPGVLSTSTPPVFIDVSDPVSGFRYSFDATSRKAYRSSFAPLRIFKPSAVGSPVRDGAPPRGVMLVAADPGVNRTGRPEVVTEELGTQTIEGVLTRGIRTTTTYPIGFFGNDRPVATVIESWTSEELGMPVLAKMSDPRSGVTTMRLFNISRAEPDASLFQPPAGYEIVSSGLL